jgi:hypothetical protein
MSNLQKYQDKIVDWLENVDDFNINSLTRYVQYHTPCVMQNKKKAIDHKVAEDFINFINEFKDQLDEACNALQEFQGAVNKMEYFNPNIKFKYGYGISEFYNFDCFNNWLASEKVEDFIQRVAMEFDKQYFVVKPRSRKHAVCIMELDNTGLTRPEQMKRNIAKRKRKETLENRLVKSKLDEKIEYENRMAVLSNC